jgi:tetratricopeptide (TPR) repeat protein
MSSNPMRSTPPSPEPELSPAATRLRAGRGHDRAGRLDEATAAYQQAVSLAEEQSERHVLVEALRRLGVLAHRRNGPARARELCRRSHDEAVALGDETLAGEALNALAGFDFEAGRIGVARGTYVRALSFAGNAAALRGRIEQNLGILDSVQGHHLAALEHYRCSLTAFEKAGDDAGCALAYHNLGLTAMRRGELDQAERGLQQSATMAARIGDLHLQALCDLNLAELDHARQRHDEATQRAEAALRVFDRLGAQSDKATAYKILGMVFRDTGRLALAGQYLNTALALASETGSVLGQAEALRELGRLHQSGGRKREALSALVEARDLFGQLEARLDLQDVNQRIMELAA